MNLNLRVCFEYFSDIIQMRGRKTFDTVNIIKTLPVKASFLQISPVTVDIFTKIFNCCICSGYCPIILNVSTCWSYLETRKETSGFPIYRHFREIIFFGTIHVALCHGRRTSDLQLHSYFFDKVWLYEIFKIWFH